MNAASQDPERGPATTPPGNAPGAAPGNAGRRRGTPLWARVLIFAAFGCAGFALLCIALVAAGVWWFVSPPRQVATASLAAPSSIGVACTSELAEDAGVRGALELVRAEIAALQEERARRETPEWVRRMQGEQRGVPLGVLRMAVPEDATFVIERLPEGGLGWALAVNFPWLVRPFKWAYEGEDRPRRRRHSIDGLEVREHQGGSAAAFVGGTYVLASDLATMRAVAPRLVAAREGDVEPRLPAELPGRHEGWDAVGLVSDAHGEREALLDLVTEGAARRTAGRVLAADLAGLDLGVDLETADRLRARLTIDVADRLAIEDWAEDLEALLAEWAALAEDKGLSLDARVDLQRDEIRVELVLDGVERWIVALVRNGGF